MFVKYLKREHYKLADKISNREAQNIINALKTKISRAKLAGRYTPEDLASLELIDDIRMAQLEAFPEMARVRQSYAEVAQPFKDVRRYLDVGKTITGIKARPGRQGREGYRGLYSDQD